MAGAVAARPMGVRFRPSDEEKVTFLVCKVTGLRLPCRDGMIGTEDVYGEKEPWEVLGDRREDEVCFFTRLKKIGKNNKRNSRNVGNGGTWSNKGQKAPIYGGKRGGIIGYKRGFRYENHNKKDDHGGTWLLKEYTLPDIYYHKAGVVKEEYKDYALCFLKRKGSSKSPAPPSHVVVVEGNNNNNNNYFMSSSGSETQNHHHPATAAYQEEICHYYQAAAAAAAPSCDLRGFAQQFIRDEKQTIPCNFHHGNKTPTPPPHVVVERIDNNNNNYFMPLGGSGSEAKNHPAAADQEEGSYYQAAAPSCDLRDFAQQFIRDEKQTIPCNFHHGNKTPTPPPHVIIERIDNNNNNYFMALGGSGSEAENHPAAADQEEGSYYQAAAPSCDLRDFAQQFIREELQTSTNCHFHHGNNLFSNPKMP